MSKLEAMSAREYNHKAIRELQRETLKDHSQVIMIALQYELERRYRLDKQLQMAEIAEQGNTVKETRRTIK